MKKAKKLIGVVALAGAAALAVAGGAATAPQATSLTIYSGRAPVFVQPLMDRFTHETGIALNVRYASSTALATALVEEGRNSPADVYWTVEPGTLGLVAARGLLARLPQKTVGRVPARFTTRSRRWVGVTARGRVLAYNRALVATGDLPASIWDLTRPRWKGKVAVAPTYASFQAFVGATLHLHGERRVRAWLEGLKENDARFYPSETPILQAVARGDVQVGLVNHYYLYRVLADDPTLPIANHWFRPGDPGNLVFPAGIGVVSASTKQAAALRFVDFLHSKWAQRRMARAPGNAEYPLIEGVPRRPGLPALRSIEAPRYNVGRLSVDIAPAVKLLLEVGFLK
jgi:iron(III) transport system substrate-binding protein